ncbi:pyridine nucleotide-disulfide oxidoreductase [Schaalia naturae]|uniref:Pyridine nucleotide-disulfide oxidoreductase n=2 Tax=Schaalia naturae TaxID=635203 RepID=A0ABW2SML9_9ACTO
MMAAHGGRGRSGASGEGIRSILRAMRSSMPVNKGAAGAPVGRRLPQIDNPVIVGAVGLGLLGAGAAVRTLRPRGRRGREERFRQRIAEALARGRGVPEGGGDAGGPGAELGLSPEDLEVRVEESFGKPTLVSVDVRVDRERLARAADGSAATPADAILLDLLDRIARAAWDNPEVAPVAVRGRITLNVAGEGEGDAVVAPGADGPSAPGAPAGGGPRVLADMTALGFPDEIARPGDLYDRYGAPASDPAWRP